MRATTGFTTAYSAGWQATAVHSIDKRRITHYGIGRIGIDPIVRLIFQEAQMPLLLRKRTTLQAMIKKEHVLHCIA